MLQALRAKSSGLIAKILFGAIVVTFSFFGIESYFVTQTQSFVAKVGDLEITQDEFRQDYDQFRQAQLRMMNGAVDASFFEQPAIKRNRLEGLIDQKVILVANDELGIAVPPQQLREEIIKIPAFLVDGQFNEDRYRSTLMSIGKSPMQFQNDIAESIATRVLPVAVASSAFVTEAEVNDYLRLNGQQRGIRFVTLAKPELADANVSDEQAGAYYEAHKAEFMNPERVSLDYLEMDAATLDVDLVPDESTLRDRYEKEKNRFVSNEQRLASHILVKVGGNGSPEEQKKALAKAEDLAKQARAGKPFAELAKTSSEDLGSKGLGGDLGWLDKDMTDPAFEAALYALMKGEISDPVLSSEGYHVIELRDIRPGSTRSFEEVRDELATEYGETERERLYTEKAGRLVNLTYEDSTSLESAAKELGMTVQKTGLFSRAGGEGIAANPAVLKAAFSDSVLVQGNNSDKIDLGPNHMVIVRVSQHQAATPKPLAEVRDEITGQVRAERLAKQAKDRADALFERLKSGTSLQAIADELKVPLQDQPSVTRQTVNVNSSLVRAAFELPRPVAGTDSYQQVELGADEFALMQLVSVSDVDPTAVDAGSRSAARSMLEQESASVAARNFVAALRAGMKIKVAEDRL